MKPSSEFFNSADWPSGDWEAELQPYYELGRKMLGVVTNKDFMEGENVLKRLGDRIGVGDTFHPTEVGVYFGEPGKTVADPYFAGAGPDRTGCTLCGGCMIGCRHGAKNSLDKNYLYFAEKWGAQIFPETKAIRIEPDNGGYLIETERTTSWTKQRSTTFRARKVILAAGVLGTVELLLKNRDQYKTLPNISAQLGTKVRTNGESLLGATSFEAHRDLARGIAIGAAIHPDKNTKIENVRYPSGSGAMRLIAVPLTEEGSKWTRPVKMLLHMITHFPRYLRLWFVRDWARSTVILLVMQTMDRQIRLKLGRSILSGLRSSLQGGATDKPVPSYIPVAQQAAKILAEEIHGEPQNVVSEVLLGIPATAHVLGGCCMGNNADQGVIDRNHEVFGHLGLYVCDGSVIPANLGVNPSLTIVALAERFCAQFPGTVPPERAIRFSPDT